MFLIQEEKRTAETSKADGGSQKDESSSKTDVAAMAASLKVCFLDFLDNSYSFVCLYL